MFVDDVEVVVEVGFDDEFVVFEGVEVDGGFDYFLEFD